MGALLWCKEDKCKRKTMQKERKVQRKKIWVNANPHMQHRTHTHMRYTYSKVGQLVILLLITEGCKQNVTIVTKGLYAHHPAYVVCHVIGKQLCGK